MPVLIAILSVIKYNFVSYIYKISLCILQVLEYQILIFHTSGILTYFADLGNLHWEGSFSREGCVWLL